MIYSKNTALIVVSEKVIFKGSSMYFELNKGPESDYVIILTISKTNDPLQQLQCLLKPFLSSSREDKDDRSDLYGGSWTNS